MHKLKIYSSALLLQANTKRLQPVSGLLSALLAKYGDMQEVARKAYITYLRSIHKQGDKEVFDVMKLPVEEFSVSLGLPMAPVVRCLKKKAKGKLMPEETSLHVTEVSDKENLSEFPRSEDDTVRSKELEVDKDFHFTDSPFPKGEQATEIEAVGYVTCLEVSLVGYFSRIPYYPKKHDFKNNKTNMNCV